jgi:hypothetical protein
MIKDTLILIAIAALLSAAILVYTTFKAPTSAVPRMDNREFIGSEGGVGA